MLIHSQQQQSDDAATTVLVQIHYTGETYPVSYLVSIDKILGRAIVHSQGLTRTTQIEREDLDDAAVAEERAVLCAIFFPQEAAA